MKRILGVVAWGILCLGMVGCARDAQMIDVLQYQEEVASYEAFRTIKESEDVKKVQDILSGVDWDLAAVEMDRPAEYLFAFPLQNPKAEVKVASYLLWVDPEEERATLALNGKEASVEVKGKAAKDLLDILVGKEAIALQHAEERLQTVEDELRFVNDMVLRDGTKNGAKELNLFYHHVEEGVKDSLIVISPGIDGGPAVTSLFYNGGDDVTVVHDNTRDMWSREEDRKISVYRCGKEVSRQYDVHGTLNAFFATDCVGEEGTVLEHDLYIYAENMKEKW